MIVSVVLNTEYMKIEERIKWFLKTASDAAKQDIVIVTHEYMRTHLQEMIDKLGKRFYGEYEMDCLSGEEIERLDICYIPDAIFDSLYKKYSTQTRTLLYLANHRNEEIENIVISHINHSLKKRNLPRPDYIQFCLHTFKSIKYLSEYYSCPLLPYVFSAVRMPHGYTQTLYMAHLGQDLFGSNAAKELYVKYEPAELDFPILNKKEIMALLGKARNLPLIPLMEMEGRYEMGVMVEGFQITPQTYQDDFVTDDDLYFESSRWYGNDEIRTRIHPMKMDRLGLTRKHMKNDPAPFLLSCKRFSTVQSQMITKAAMWNRVPCVLGDALPFAFLFTRDFTSNEVVSDEDLNFLLFCYFVPDTCMFDIQYWNWRKTNPSPSLIMKKHLEVIFQQLGYARSAVYASEERLKLILEGRGCSEEEIREIVSTVSKESIVNECLSSRIRVRENGNVSDKYCRNVRREGGYILSRFEFCSFGNKEIDLMLLNDVDGYVSVYEVSAGQEGLDISFEHKYIAKGESVCSISLDKEVKTLDVIWKVADFESVQCI